jgi:hypothetical protein
MKKMKICDVDDAYNILKMMHTNTNIVPLLDSKEVQNPQSAVMYSRSLREKLNRE